MAERTGCSSCQGKRTILCTCCSGKGWVLTIPYPAHFGKAHICIDCTGQGEIPCPQCRPEQILTPARNLNIAPRHI